MSACGSCGKQVNRGATDKIICADCNKIFHAACAKLKTEDLDVLSGKVWSCKSCNEAKRLRRGMSDSVPVLSPVSGSRAAVSLGDIRSVVDGVKSEILEGQKKLEEDVFARLAVVLERLDSFSDLLKRQDEIASKQQTLIENLLKENDSLKSRLSEVELKLDEQEQYSRRNTVEILGIPEKPREDVLETVMEVCGALEMGVDAGSIDACHRLKKRNNRPTSAIVVKFVRRSDADRLLQLRKKKGAFTTKSIGFPGESSIYVNRSLTACRRVLFAKAKEQQRRHGWKYVWLDGAGRVKVRSEDGGSVRTVRCEKDLTSLAS
jgi:hypothetical protein